MKKLFYSNGKLLLTGEYLVLDGALALALPTRFGQDLSAEESSAKTITWKSIGHDNDMWFETDFPFDEIQKGNTAGNDIRSRLVQILHATFRLNPNFLASGYNVTTRLTFPRQWGLGSSSTLINNIAQWANVDAYELLRQTFGGSGYDIAAAQHDAPIFYQLHNGCRRVNIVDFNPPFADNLYFVYLNRKQDSRSSIEAYRKAEPAKIAAAVPLVNSISERIVSSETTAEFSRLLQQHEDLLSEILNIPTVKESAFRGFPGTVKSLGGWGGDFVLAVSEVDPAPYFKSKGYLDVLPYRAMIK